MDISVCDTSEGLEHKMKKRKQEQCDDAHEDSNMDSFHYEDSSIVDNALSEPDPTPDATIIVYSKLETETGQFHLEICNSKGSVQEMEQTNDDKSSTNKDTEHENGNGSRNFVLNKSNVGDFDVKYDTEVERLSSVNTNEDSRIAEDPSNMREDDDHSTTTDLAQESSMEMIDGRNEKDTTHQCTKELSGSDYHLQSTEQGCEKDSSLKWSIIDQINGSYGDDTENMKGSAEEASICCSVGGDETSTSKELIAVTPSCKPSEVQNAETRKEVACSSGHGESSNDINAIVKENTLSLTTDTSKKGDSTDCSRKKLLVLDVNGLLADFIIYVPCGYQPDITIGNKAVFKRPFCDDFIKFCFERFEEKCGHGDQFSNGRLQTKITLLLGKGFWLMIEHSFSIAIASYNHLILSYATPESCHICGASKKDQSHCTDSGFNTVENMHKPLVLKELRKLWKYLKPFGEYNASNTLLLDDSPHKALCNPANTAIFPVTYRFRDTEDTSLGPGGDLRVYLEGLSMAENVQKYVEKNPFGERPITEKNLSWTFYRRIIYFVERKNVLDESASASSNCKW